MTSEVFSQRILAMEQSLYKISYALLPRRCDREDAVQECVYRAWRRLPSLREEERFEKWVIRILINACYDLMRQRRGEEMVEEWLEAEAPPDADPFLYDAILALDQPLRLTVVLHYMEGYDLKDTARLLHLPVGTVKSRLHRARRQLQESYFKEVWE